MFGPLPRDHRALFHAHRKVSEQVPDSDSGPLLGMQLVVRRSRQLSIDSFGVMKGHGVVGTVFVMTRDNRQEGHGGK